MANELARALRKRMTPEEVKLWVILRGFKPQGRHFRRQVPIGPYIVDFAEKSSRIVIEVDGTQHAEAGNLRRDEERDAYLAKLDYRVLRFWNAEVNHALDGTIDAIQRALEEPHPRRSGGALPASGEG